MLEAAAYYKNDASMLFSSLQIEGVSTLFAEYMMIIVFLILLCNR